MTMTVTGSDLEGIGEILKLLRAFENGSDLRLANQKIEFMYCDSKDRVTIDYEDGAVLIEFTEEGPG